MKEHEPQSDSKPESSKQISSPAGMAERSPSILFQLGMMCLVGLLFAAALEGGARVFNLAKIDPDQSVLFYQRIGFPLFEKTRLENGSWVFRGTDPRLGSQQFPVEKAANTFRVFVFGGSATNGLGFSPNVRFSNYLEDMLQQAAAGKEIEVVNVGVIGFSSRQTKQMVAHVRAAYSPDLLVVYSGNNEFLELHAKMFTDQKINARILHIQDTLGSSHFYRWLRASIQGAQARRSGKGQQDEGFAKFAFSESELIQSFRITHAEYDFVAKKYAENIHEIIENAGSTPMILSTVASNLRWNDPDEMQVDWMADFMRQRGTPLTAEEGRGTSARVERVAKALEDDLRKLEVEGDPLNLGQDAIHFRLGKIYEERGDFARAKSEYELARDLDKRSRRALGRFNQIVLAAGREYARDNLVVIDMEKQLSEEAPHGIIGSETFYDYVHFSPLGAQRTAAILARAIGQNPSLLPAVGRADYAGLSTYDYAAVVTQWDDELHQRSQDYPQANRWLGFNFDKAEIGATDLFKFSKGVTSLKNMMDLGRQDPWIRVYLGNAYYHDLGGEKQALELYRDALQRAGSSDHEVRSAVLENMGAIYRRLGRDQDAQQYLRMAETIRKSSPEEARVALDTFLKVQ